MLLIIILIALILIILLIISGPRVKIDTTLKSINLPEIDKLDNYLKKKESLIPNLIVNTEKIIKWSKINCEKSHYSIIYIHGFTATRQETAPVTDLIAQKLKANVFYCRLKGHGRDDEGIKDVTVNDWINDAYEAYEIGKIIGDKIIIIAVSTGVPLALWLSAKFSNIAAVIMMSPNFQPADKSSNLILWPWGNIIIKLVAGKYMQWNVANELHKKYWTTTYRSEALLPMMGLCKLGRNLHLDKITLPVLCLYTEKDNVVSIPVIKEIFENLGSSRKKLINTNAEDHVIAGDIISPETNDSTVEYINDFLDEVL
ncbi:MAG: alpha/beta hydrolase [Spirochaetales bacterium]|nr:alpha/beta hydrolase [Spirochaetales bacterium]